MPSAACVIFSSHTGHRLFSIPLLINFSLHIKQVRFALPFFPVGSGSPLHFRTQPHPFCLAPFMSWRFTRFLQCGQRNKPIFLPFFVLSVTFLINSIIKISQLSLPAKTQETTYLHANQGISAYPAPLTGISFAPLPSRQPQK